jgi:hypothetical protein
MRGKSKTLPNWVQDLLEEIAMRPVTITRTEAKELCRLILGSGSLSELPPGHERIEALVDGPYLELFAREQRPGWDSWGDEAGTGPAQRRWASNSYSPATQTQPQQVQSEIQS